MPTDQLRRLAVTTLVAVGVTLTTAGAPALASTVPHVRGTATVPAYSNANAIRESVWVRTRHADVKSGSASEHESALSLYAAVRPSVRSSTRSPAGTDPSRHPPGRRESYLDVALISVAVRLR